MTDVHDLKILTKYFEAQKSGVKNFEIRKKDRDYKVGDTLNLREIKDGEGVNFTYTGRNLLVKITYIISSSYLCGMFEGVDEGFCVMGTEQI